MYSGWILFHEKKKIKFNSTPLADWQPAIFEYIQRTIHWHWLLFKYTGHFLYYNSFSPDHWPLHYWQTHLDCMVMLWQLFHSSLKVIFYEKHSDIEKRDQTFILLFLIQHSFLLLLSSGFYWRISNKWCIHFILS